MQAMNRRLSVPLPVALLLAGLAPLGLVLAPSGDASLRGKAGTIAVVDLKKVFDNDATLKDDIVRINARGKEEEEKIKKMREAYNALKLELEAIGDQSNDKYVSVGAQMFAKDEEIKRYKAGIEAWLEREGAERNLKALQRYRVLIAQIATQRGLEAVLRVTDPDDKERSLSSRMQAAELGMVLYRDPKLDITEDVIKLLKAK